MMPRLSVFQLDEGNLVKRSERILKTLGAKTKKAIADGTITLR